MRSRSFSVYMCLAFIENSDLPKINIITLDEVFNQSVFLKYFTDFQKQIILKGSERINFRKELVFRHKKLNVM